MANLAEVAKRYSAVEALQRNGVTLLQVVDDVMSELDNLLRQVSVLARTNAYSPWGDLYQMLSRVYWCLLLSPLPFQRNPLLRNAVGTLTPSLERMRATVTEQSLVTRAIAVVEAVARSEVRVSVVLEESVNDVGRDRSVLLTANRRSRELFRNDEAFRGVLTLTQGELVKMPALDADITFYVGPPVVFPASSVAAPRTEEVTFVFPQTFRVRALPESMLTQFAPRPLKYRVREQLVGTPSHLKSEHTETNVDLEADLLAAPWQHTEAPGSDEAGSDAGGIDYEPVLANKVLLAGGRATWIESDADRIRALDVSDSGGLRLKQVPVDEIDTDTVLILREGASEAVLLRQRAIDMHGDRGKEVWEQQTVWKSALQSQIAERGLSYVEARLKKAGVRAYRQVRAWTYPETIRPRSDEDFARLLAWLQLPIEPHYTAANDLRKFTLVASREFQKAIEAALQIVDPDDLDETGYVVVSHEGGARVVAARVLDVAPRPQRVSPSLLRVSVPDKGAKWLE